MGKQRFERINFSKIRWRLKFRRFIKKENRYTDFETKKVLYRGAPYCLNCRSPVFSYGSFCKDCDNQETKLPRVPYDVSGSKISDINTDQP